MPVKITAVVGVPLHTVWFAITSTVGVGFTVIVNVLTGPVHVVPPLVYDGVIVIVAVTGEPVALVAVNAGILPVPLAPRPMDGVLFVQLYEVPATGPLIVTAAVEVLLQTTWLLIAFTEGVGFTVMVKVIGVPEQVVPPLVYIGVTVKVAEIGAFVEFVAMNDGMFPVPLADARPIAVLLFVQLNTVPATVPLKLIAAVGEPLQTTWLATALTVGVGFTVIVNVIGAPVQLTPLVIVGVTVIVAVTGALVALVPTNEGIFPLPLAARPIDGVLLVQL